MLPQQHKLGAGLGLFPLNCIRHLFQLFLHGKTAGMGLGQLLPELFVLHPLALVRLLQLRIAVAQCLQLQSVLPLQFRQ